jgi:hypothetical protein
MEAFPLVLCRIAWIFLDKLSIFFAVDTELNLQPRSKIFATPQATRQHRARVTDSKSVEIKKEGYMQILTC